jgi:general secretion pathway protein J
MTRRSRGFTLLELIVVIGIFGVLSAMAYGGLNSVMKSRAAVEQSFSRTGELQRAYLRLRNDVQLAQWRPARDAYGDLQPAFFTDREGHVVWTRGGWQNPTGLPRSTLQRIAYRYDADKKLLIRGSYRVLDLGQDAQPVEVELLDKVEDAQWRFLDASRQWTKQWPPQNQVGSVGSIAPPLAVELTLHVTDLGEVRWLFRLGMDPWPANLRAPNGGGGG